MVDALSLCCCIALVNSLSLSLSFLEGCNYFSASLELIPPKKSLYRQMSGCSVDPVDEVPK